MDHYFEYVHNLIGENKYEKLKPTTQDAIVSHYIRELESLNSLEQAICTEKGCEVLNYIQEHFDLTRYYKSIILTTKASSFVDDVDFNNVRTIINLHKVNHVHHLNALFCSVNKLLPDAGFYFGCLETYVERKFKFYKMAGRRIGRLLWLTDFVLNRVIPRIPYLEGLYYFVTKGRFHAISKAEVLGRLVYCGFEIVDFRIINGLSYFVAMKTREPIHVGHPTYYPVIRLHRVGKHGKMIHVYKFRTMHPYSEFLQDYVIKLNGYNDKGKPAADFRVTRWGRFFRKFWIDEVPQLINVLKGEMKLVGVRPLSKVRFNEFPDDLKLERVKYKPGCFPPYVALNMPDDIGNIEAERIYIRDLHKNPYFTDIRYFMKAMYNILSNRIRSS